MVTLTLRNVKCLNHVKLRACKCPLSELEAKHCVLYLTSLFTKDNHLVASWRNKRSVPILSTNRESGNKKKSRYCPRGWNCSLFNAINFFPLSLGPVPRSSSQRAWVVTSKQCDWTLDWPRLRLAGFVSVPARMCERNTKSAKQQTSLTAYEKLQMGGKSRLPPSLSFSYFSFCHTAKPSC